MRGGLSASLLSVLADDILRERLAALQEGDLPDLAGRLVARDAYGNNAQLRGALALMGARSPDVMERHVEHVLWCGWREARSRRGDALEIESHVVDRVHFESVGNRPTVLLAPMTLCLPDAARLLADLAGGRPLIIYGEGLTDGSASRASGRFAPEGLAGLAEIVQVLDEGGIFATYADFVYGTHRQETMTLFGVPRPVSSAFIGLLGRPDTVVLPLSCVRGDDEVRVHLQPPWPVGPGVPRADRVAEVSARLEDAIRVAPHQWLLASTLTFDSPQALQPEGQPDERASAAVASNR